MSILCLWSPAWRTGGGVPAEILPILLEEVPRVVVEARGILWADVRGLPVRAISDRLLKRLEQGVGHEREGTGDRAQGTGNTGQAGVRGGIAGVPIAALAAAIHGPEPVTGIGAGMEAAFLAPLSISLLTEDERLLVLFEGAGISTCGRLAHLTAEAIEVRFGAEGVRTWKLARGDDPRILFRPIPHEQPVASVDFVDYTVRDATRLVFTLNALLEQVCDALRDRARRARSITLAFQLADGSQVREVMRTARPTADRGLWLRRLRAVLEGVRLGQPIAGVAIEVGASEPASGLQGDLFDRGFATASFVEEAVARLLDLYQGLFVRQWSVSDPLAERRARWTELMPEEVASTEEAAPTGSRPRKPKDSPPSNGPAAASEDTSEVPRDRPITTSGVEASAHPALELQLLPDPRPIRIRSRSRRDHVIPIRYLDGNQWRDLTSAGPDRISGGHEEARPYAREYFRCVSDAGALLWLYRDAVEDRWFLHGWWE